MLNKGLNGKNKPYNQDKDEILLKNRAEMFKQTINLRYTSVR